MIKLSEIANTIIEGRSVPVDIEYVKNVLNKSGVLEYTTRTFLYNKIIYRGLNNDADFLYVSPKKFNRESANTSNEYTLLMDNSPLWKKYPKRSKSLVCSTNVHKAHQYGTIYIVIPVELSAKFGVCSDSDIWDSFKNINEYEPITYLFRRMYTLTEMLKDMTDSDEVYKELEIILKNPFNDLVNLFKFFSVFDEYKDVFEPNVLEDHGEFFIKWFYGTKSMADHINYEMSPKKNNFLLDKYYSNSAVIGKDKEVWTDSDCILINYRNKWEDTLSILRSKNI